MTGPARADATTCARAIAKASAQSLQASIALQQRCADRVLSGRAPGPCPDTATLLALGQVESELRAKLDAHCGGPDRSCGDGTDESLASIGWAIGTCPGLAGSACANAIHDCSDVADCLVCLNASAAARYRALHYGASASAQPALAACQREIGRAAARFLRKQSQALQRCEDARFAAPSAPPCPDLKATTMIARARDAATRILCRTCGGADRICGGPGLDLGPAALGFAPACPSLTQPLTGTQCGRSVDTLGDLVDCSTCVTEFDVTCLDRAAVPRLESYPSDCNPPPTPTVTPTPTATPSATPTWMPPALVFARYAQPNLVCSSDGAGSFSCAAVSADSGRTVRVAVADLDGDLDLDAVFPTSLDVPNRRCLGDGTGGFACADLAGTVPVLPRSAALALGDLGHDGVPDVVFGNTSGQTNLVCAGDGTGQFPTCAAVSLDAGETFGVALADVNEDGRLDALFARFGATNRVCFGNGAGGFSSCIDLESDVADSVNLAVTDLDGDGHLDVIVANQERIPARVPPTHDRVCRGNGTGAFSCADVSADADRSTSLAVGDVDEDGAPDVVFSVQGTNRLCTGDGAGGFTCAAWPDIPSHAGDVALTDLNGDAHLDAVFTYSDAGVAARRCLGDGTGSFACADVTGAVATSGVAAGPLRR